MTIGQAQPENYDKQLQEKVELTKTEFDQFYQGPIDVFESPSSNFRMRAEFKVWHEGDTSHFAMYKPGEYKTPVVIDEFSIGARRICELMPKILNVINETPIIRERLFQIEFLSTTTGECLISLIIS